VAAFFGGLRSLEDNEPIDPIIYMITAALGFVALENTLFIFGPLISDDFTTSIITGNLRFIGASLLHVLSSGIIGVFLAFSFYKPKSVRIIMASFGLVLAIIFHTAFNLLIIHLDNLGAMLAFGLVWIGIVMLLLAFEKAKTIAK
jgi:RsiW-degrading membrane proteinase PrsW (M82 family)